jgi:gamma-glutamylcyclotransferase (GGCT)/AIG2-like uncharacterized protein YtfP
MTEHLNPIAFCPILGSIMPCNEPMTNSTPLNSIFVYGTLKRHGIRQHLWPYPPMRIMRSRVQGQLYAMGHYPALSRPGTDWICGERWILAPETMRKTLQVLDDIEGYCQRPDDLYFRCIVECHDEDGSVHAAFTYQFAQTDRLLMARRIRASAQGVCLWPLE